ncbi:hypothetical protein [Bradyrhizobium stylosanthis]|uniref:hypothetical protein n=1 Tax=Bradyrhizobium stylosanthis TaxID=1803665 RepID=UPI0007C470BB|nr:hypothetical protein [Bradyrhizobium stylosanthis]
MTRRHPIRSADLHSIGGIVSVLEARDRDGEPCFRIRHISRGGDLSWLSERIGTVDRADAGAEALAQFLGASVVRQ